MQEKKGVMGCTRSGGDTISVSINRKPSPNHRFGIHEITLVALKRLHGIKKISTDYREDVLFFFCLFFMGVRGRGQSEGPLGVFHCV